MGNSASLEPLQQAQTFEQINTWVNEVCVAGDITKMNKDENIKTEEAFKIFLSKKNIILNQNASDPSRAGFVVGYFFIWFFHSTNGGILLARLFLENAQDIYSLFLDSVKKNPYDCEPILALLRLLLHHHHLAPPSTQNHPIANLFGFDEFVTTITSKQERDDVDPSPPIPRVIEELAYENKSRVISHLNTEIQRKIKAETVPHRSLVKNAAAIESFKVILSTSKSFFDPRGFAVTNSLGKEFTHNVQQLVTQPPGMFHCGHDLKSNDCEILRSFLLQVEESLGIGKEQELGMISRHNLTQLLIWFFTRTPEQCELRSSQEMQMFKNIIFKKQSITKDGGEEATSLLENVKAPLGDALYNAIVKSCEAGLKLKPVGNAVTDATKVLQSILFMYNPKEGKFTGSLPQTSSDGSSSYFDLAAEFLATPPIIKFLEDKKTQYYYGEEAKKVLEALKEKLGTFEG